jgi:hypothetical protein
MPPRNDRSWSAAPSPPEISRDRACDQRMLEARGPPTIKLPSMIDVTTTAARLPDALADSHDLYDHTGIGRYVDAIARVFLGDGDVSPVDLDGPDGAAFQRRRDSCLSGVKRETE